MGEENRNFKSRVFGGFDRNDVSKYIEELAAERNSLQEENERLKDQLDRMEKEYSDKSSAADLRISQLEEELANERLQANDVVIAAAENILSEFRCKYEQFRADMELNLAHARCEMINAKECVDGLWNMFDVTEKHLNELENSVYDMKKHQEEN